SRIARERGLTINALVQAAWAVTLSRSTGRDDVVFGATVSGRPPELAGVERMVGLFINTLPVRVQLHPGQTLGAVASAIRDDQSALLGHQHIALPEILQSTRCRELFDTLYVFENYPLERTALVEALGDLRVTSAESRDATHYPFTVIVVPGDRMRV